MNVYYTPFYIYGRKSSDEEKNGLGFGILQAQVTDEPGALSKIMTKKCNAYTCINNIYLLLFKNPAIIKIIVIF